MCKELIGYDLIINFRKATNAPLSLANSYLIRMDKIVMLTCTNNPEETVKRKAEALYAQESVCLDQGGTDSQKQKLTPMKQSIGWDLAPTPLNSTSQFATRHTSYFHRQVPLAYPLAHYQLLKSEVHKTTNNIDCLRRSRRQIFGHSPIYCSLANWRESKQSFPLSFWVCCEVVHKSSWLYSCIGFLA